MSGTCRDTREAACSLRFLRLNLGMFERNASDHRQDAYNFDPEKVAELLKKGGEINEEQLVAPPACLKENQGTHCRLMVFFMR